jgi:hypothetical protein
MNRAGRIGTTLSLAMLAAWTAGNAQAKKYAPPRDAAATATLRFETTNSAVRTKGRNYATVAAFPPDRCHERDRKQAGMATMNMRDRSENSFEAIPVEAGKPIALSFFYLGITDIHWGGDYDTRHCVVDGVATFAPGDRVVARFEIDDEVKQCKVTFTSEATTAPAVPSTFDMYPLLCWPEDVDESTVGLRSGEGWSTRHIVEMAQ